MHNLPKLIFAVILSLYFLWIAWDPMQGSFPDWNYLLTATGLIGSTKTVAGIIRFAGTFTIITASVLSVYFSIYQPNEKS